MLEDVYWHLEARIIVERYSGLITLADVERGKEQTLSLIREKTYGKPIHVVIDATKREAYAPEILKLPTVRQVLRYERDIQLGWLMIVNPTPHPIMRFMVTAAARIASNQLKIVTSFDEAIAFLHSIDSSLSESVNST